LPTLAELAAAGFAVRAPTGETVIFIGELPQRMRQTKLPHPLHREENVSEH
jgi:hypothetical protein